MPKLNEAIRLNLQLDDYDDTKFVRAILKDAAGVPLAASPVELTNQGDGLYGDSSQLMPNTPQVKATYMVYDDEDFTELNADFGAMLDTFDLVTDSALAIQSPGADFEVEVESASSVDLVVETSSELQIETEEC